jgi:CDP-diacylglycerol---glycerol-3-phosphate 3-phosphatidyltransferase
VSALIAAWLPLGLLLASMPLFALTASSKVRDANVASRPATSLLGLWVRDWMVWVLGPLERSLVRQRVSPLSLNIIGLVFGLLAGVALAAGLLALGAWLIALGGICDILDGRVARALGVTSTRGAFLDSTLDRFAEVFVYAGIAWYLSSSPVLAVITLLAISGSLLVSYARARGEALGLSFAGGLAQRAERLVVLAFAALADPLVSELLTWPSGRVLAIAVITIAAASFGTALYRTVSIVRALPNVAREKETAGRP